MKDRKFIKYNDEDFEYIINLNPGADCILYGKGDKRIYLYHPKTPKEKIVDKLIKDNFNNN